MKPTMYDVAMNELAHHRYWLEFQFLFYAKQFSLSNQRKANTLGRISEQFFYLFVEEVYCQVCRIFCPHSSSAKMRTEPRMTSEPITRPASSTTGRRGKPSGVWR